jgi:hypothetical protein
MVFVKFSTLCSSDLMIIYEPSHVQSHLKIAYVCLLLALVTPKRDLIYMSKWQ